MVKRKWTAREERILRKHYPEADLQKLADMLDRSLQSIQRRAWDLKIHRKVNFWTELEDQYIREHYATTATKKIAEVIKRSINSINIRAFEMGISKNQDYLRNRCNYPNHIQGKKIGPVRFKVLNRKGYYEEWSGSFADIEDAKKWYSYHGWFHEMRGRKLKLFELKTGKEVLI